MIAHFLPLALYVGVVMALTGMLTGGLVPAQAVRSVAAPCDCGQPIPAGRTAYCSDRCRWADDDHGNDYDDIEAAA